MRASPCLLLAAALLGTAGCPASTTNDYATVILTLKRVYGVPAAGVPITVHDATGHLVASLVSTPAGTGRVYVPWNGIVSVFFQAGGSFYTRSFVPPTTGGEIRISDIPPTPDSTPTLTPTPTMTPAPTPTIPPITYDVTAAVPPGTTGIASNGLCDRMASFTTTAFSLSNAACASSTPLPTTEFFATTDAGVTAWGRLENPSAAPGTTLPVSVSVTSASLLAVPVTVSGVPAGWKTSIKFFPADGNHVMDIVSTSSATASFLLHEVPDAASDHTIWWESSIDTGTGEKEWWEKVQRTATLPTSASFTAAEFKQILSVSPAPDPTTAIRWNASSAPGGDELFLFLSWTGGGMSVLMPPDHATRFPLLELPPSLSAWAPGTITYWNLVYCDYIAIDGYASLYAPSPQHSFDRGVEFFATAHN